MKLRSRSKYLKAADLNGKELALQMNYVEYELLRGQEDEQPVLYFTDDTKPLVLNATNEKAIKSVFGEETDDWADHTIVLFPTTTQFGGNTVDCIRIRLPVPALEPAPAADSSVPF